MKKIKFLCTKLRQTSNVIKHNKSNTIKTNKPTPNTSHMIKVMNKLLIIIHLLMISIIINRSTKVQLSMVKTMMPSLLPFTLVEPNQSNKNRSNNNMMAAIIMKKSKFLHIKTA